MKFETKLDEVMASQGRKNGWLAEEVGISRQSVRNYRKGKTDPYKLIKTKIAEVLDVDETVLFGWAKKQNIKTEHQ